MNRRIVVLKMVVLALDEMVAKGERITPKRLVALTLQYGRGVNIEVYEITPFCDRTLLDAICEIGALELGGPI